MDSRKLDSPHWINPEDVNLFKDKVGKVRPLLLYLTPYCDHSLLEKPTGHTPRSASWCRLQWRYCHWRNRMAQHHGAWWPCQMPWYLHRQMEECRSRSTQEDVHPFYYSKHLLGSLLTWSCSGHMYVTWYVAVNCTSFQNSIFHYTFCWHVLRMKYFLAVVKWLYDEFGPDICLGYDIMCAFWKTLLWSSLGADTVAFHLSGVILAFHDHAHNQGC